MLRTTENTSQQLPINYNSNVQYDHCVCFSGCIGYVILKITLLYFYFLYEKVIFISSTYPHTCLFNFVNKSAVSAARRYGLPAPRRAKLA